MGPYYKIHVHVYTYIHKRIKAFPFMWSCKILYIYLHTVICIYMYAVICDSIQDDSDDEATPNAKRVKTVS